MKKRGNEDTMNLYFISCKILTAFSIHNKWAVPKKLVECAFFPSFKMLFFPEIIVVGFKTWKILEYDFCKYATLRDGDWI